LGTIDLLGRELRFGHGAHVFSAVSRFLRAGGVMQYEQRDFERRTAPSASGMDFGNHSQHIEGVQIVLPFLGNMERLDRRRFRFCDIRLCKRKLAQRVASMIR
jgi:hypothetical protein